MAAVSTALFMLAEASNFSSLIFSIVIFVYKPELIFNECLGYGNQEPSLQFKLLFLNY
jgi:hypothetical protein